MFHEFGHSATYWPAIEQVTTTAEYMFIYVSSMSAFIVPLRDLRTAPERQIFVNTVTRYYSESRQEPASTAVFTG